MYSTAVLLFAAALFAQSGFAQLADQLDAPDPEMDAVEREVEEEEDFTRPAGQGRFGPHRIGATLLIGFPHPLNYSIEYVYDRRIGAAFTMGNFELRQGDNRLDISNWDMRGRWFPTRHNFFAGAALGSQTIDVTAERKVVLSGTATLTKAELQINSLYLTPHIGWFSVWYTGITVGCEIGYQLPLSAKAKALKYSTGDAAKDAEVASNADFAAFAKDVKKAGDTFGKQGQPYVTLLRVGWMM